MKETAMKLIVELIGATSQKKLWWEKSTSNGYNSRPGPTESISLRKDVFPLRPGSSGIDHISLYIWGGKDNTYDIDFYNYKDEIENYKILEDLYNIVEENFLKRISEKGLSSILSSIKELVNENLNKDSN